MADMMTFPDTVEEFMEQYKMTDTKQVYSNGIEYVPIFRMKQWFEQEKAQLFSEDATSDPISRQAALDIFDDYNVSVENGELEAYSRDRKRMCELPPAQPEPTYEQVEEYCKKRCLHIVTDDFFESTKPQRLGHWIQYDKRFPWRHHYKCSECGNYLDFSGVNGGRGEVNFCPNCGARMKGAKHETN